MKTTRLHILALLISAGLSAQLAAQVQTEVPAVVDGAKSDTVEYMKVHGVSLEGVLFS